MLKELKLKDYFTLLGTLCGFATIIFVISPNLYAPRGAAFMVFFGILADLLDGYVARKTNTMNELGKELDSLSDSIVFGVAPAIMMYIVYQR